MILLLQISLHLFASKVFNVPWAHTLHITKIIPLSRPIIPLEHILFEKYTLGERPAISKNFLFHAQFFVVLRVFLYLRVYRIFSFREQLRFAPSTFALYYTPK